MREVTPPLEQYARRRSTARKRSELRHWRAGFGDRDVLTVVNALDDLTTVISQFPYRHVGHAQVYHA